MASGHITHTIPRHQSTSLSLPYSGHRTLGVLAFFVHSITLHLLWIYHTFSFSLDHDTGSRILSSSSSTFIPYDQSTYGTFTSRFVSRQAFSDLWILLGRTIAFCPSAICRVATIVCLCQIIPQLFLTSSRFLSFARASDKSYHTLALSSASLFGSVLGHLSYIDNLRL